MDENSKVLRTTVLQVLNDIPQSLDFEYANFRVSPAQLQQVRTAIAGNRISCKYDSTKGNTFEYNPLSDELAAGVTLTSDVQVKALLVHECVHALMDMLSTAVPNAPSNTKWKVVDSEAAAYIAQAIYFRIKTTVDRPGYTPPYLSGPDAETDAIIQAAKKIAARKQPKFEKLDSDPDIPALKKAITAHSLYKKRAQKYTLGNGVPLCIGAGSSTCGPDDNSTDTPDTTNNAPVVSPPNLPASPPPSLDPGIRRPLY
jgi:hypothetical protein